jgi:DNA polymerase-4
MFVAHFDVDAFYASVEIRDDPTLAGKPVAVAGRSRRAVVLTASYEARPYGVKSAVPLYRALEACPHLTVVPPNMAKYKAVSREIFAIFGAGGHAVEGLSMDEAFIAIGDVSLEDATAFARDVRARVLESVGLTMSAGVASGKMIAKIASDFCKPNGLLAIPLGTEREFLAPLPVGRLWGVGPKTQDRLTAHGVATIGDVAALDEANLHAMFGSSAERVGDLARGVDHRIVDTSQETKSISTEETFEYDVTDEAELVKMLKIQAVELAESLERHGLSASTVGIKIRKADRTNLVRQVALTEPTRDVRRIYRAALHCLKRAEVHGTPVRLLGTRLANITEGAPAQIGLFAQQ